MKSLITKVLQKSADKNNIEKIVLELSEDEATVLLTVSRHISGVSQERKVMDGIERGLCDQGVYYLSAGGIGDRVMQDGYSDLQFKGGNALFVAKNDDGDVKAWDRKKIIK